MSVVWNLPFASHEDWRKRWLVLPSGKVLHRIQEPDLDVWGDYEGDNWGQLTGSAICNVSGTFAMPGFVSRMYLPRCVKCCNMLKIPHGDGNPYNQKPKIDEPTQI